MDLNFNAGVAEHLYFNNLLIYIFGEARTAQFSQIHSPHFHAGAPGIFSDLLKSVQMLKRDCGAESNGKLPYLFIPGKTATLVPQFAVEGLPLDSTATMVPEFAMEDLSLGRKTLMIVKL